MDLIFGGMFVFITASPFVYIEHFGISPLHYAWLFALNIGGIMGVSFLKVHFVGLLGSLRLLGFGVLVVAGSGLACCSAPALRWEVCRHWCCAYCGLSV
ncbi:hypothetical protein [Pseudomonas frederiksbergensis]|uniref:hypothetical protein n=1 Tax=Pseudomonas frederiksbergensis TaxID=104087 RepID=UPI001F2F738D|nr:hypothetical protein [Pseudomonas frederiksbergensis]